MDAGVRLEVDPGSPTSITRLRLEAVNALAAASLHVYRDSNGSGNVAAHDAVVSALGHTSKEPDLHSRSANALIEAIPAAGMTRFIGVSKEGGGHSRRRAACGRVGRA